jgi:tetratricopeptide (TPR) repeat protein
VGRLPSVLSLGDLERIDMGDLIYRPIRRAMGVSAFGINAYTGTNPGDEVIEPHDEKGDGSGHHEELYVVMTGHARFELDGETIDAPAGTMVLARPDQHRAATATAEETTILVIGGKPGAAGPPSPFEYWYLAEPAYRAKDYERAYAIAAEGLANYPDNAPLQYQLGCYAARAGRGEDAVQHIQRAFGLNPKSREWAKDDADLASIRDRLAESA